MTTVLVDGRIDAVDGIGRYTRCTVAALRACASPDLRIEVLRPTGTPRYGPAEGEELLRAAERVRADIVHSFDYRIPWLIPDRAPRWSLVVTVHDVIRLVMPDQCYGDAAFEDRFGPDGMRGLRASVAALRDRVPPACGAAAMPRSLHEEFYARMMRLAAERAARIVVPTRTVEQQVRAMVAGDAPLLRSPWGADHLSDLPDLPDLPGHLGQPGLAGREAGALVLYVGQARGHKQFGALLDGYAASRASACAVPLVCAGNDFAPGGPGAATVRAHPAADRVVLLGPVGDALLAGLYARAAALVHLAAYEGFGFPPLEALACGSRVVAADTPVLRETLGPHAWFVDPADVSGVAALIDRAVERPDQPAARAARRRWADGYRWADHAATLLRLYADLRPDAPLAR
jgi:glycosyltransferase involved in cell wall biosynthesis